jgi:tetratricopeptide (TPR) repeat protein
VNQFQEQLGKNLAELALMEHDAHRDQKAAASIKRSIEILEPLVQARPDQPRLRHDLGRSWNIQGFLQDEIRQNARAIESFNRAVDSESRAIAQYLDLGDVPQALPHYRREAAIFEELVTSRPDSPEYVLTLVDAIAKVATIERHAGDPAAAVESLKRAENVLERLADPSGKPRSRHGAILTAHAAAAADLRQADLAVGLLQRAFTIFSSLDSNTSTDDQTREFRGDALRERARVLRANGKLEEARASEEDWTALWKDQPPARLAAVALKETSQALLIGYGKTPITDVGRELRELELDRAAALLRLAISLGFRDIAQLRQNPDSWALLERPDLATALKSLESSPSHAEPIR